jgi:NADPH:quinone reductase-like Zn-dependent oxidoreductase
MHAAVVTEFDHAPRYVEFDEPVVGDEMEVVDVVAAALHPRVRSQAAGTHYTSGALEDGEELPLIPGIDGVGRRSDGSLCYFVLPDTRFGSMAERVAIDVRRSIPLANGADPIAIAAAMNPAMSSWVALRRRAHLEPGQSVLVLGATGSAGQLAVQVAKRLGASRVVAAGRDRASLDSLHALGADAVVSLAGDETETAVRVGEAAAEVDVVIDYLWGRPAELVLPALVIARSDRSRLLSWVQVGAITGPEISLPSAVLRQANVMLMGSGQGSVSTGGILEELVPLVAEIESGAFTLDTEVRRLNDVESVWNEPRNARRRTVFAVA